MEQFIDDTIGATTTTSFYVFNSRAELIHRYDAFDITDVGNTRIFYGRDIVTVSGKMAFIYVQGRILTASGLAWGINVRSICQFIPWRLFVGGQGDQQGKYTENEYATGQNTRIL